MSKYTPDCKNRWYKQLNKRKSPESGKDPDVMVISDDSNAAESSDSEADVKPEVRRRIHL